MKAKLTKKERRRVVVRVLQAMEKRFRDLRKACKEQGKADAAAYGVLASGLLLQRVHEARGWEAAEFELRTVRTFRGNSDLQVLIDGAFRDVK